MSWSFYIQILILSFDYAQDGEPFDLESFDPELTTEGLMAVSLQNGWSNHFEFRYSDFEFVDSALSLNR
jgi:hypothetical protein